MIQFANNSYVVDLTAASVITTICQMTFLMRNDYTSRKRISRHGLFLN